MQFLNKCYEFLCKWYEYLCKFYEFYENVTGIQSDLGAAQYQIWACIVSCPVVVILLLGSCVNLCSLLFLLDPKVYTP